MAHKKITTRWLTGNLGVIVIILVIVEIIFGFGVQSFYYNSVRQLLYSQSNMVGSLLQRYSEDGSVDYKKEVRNLIENFAMRDKMELMALDRNGNVTTTSSGFKIEEKMYMPDFDTAFSSSEQIGEFRGRAGDENIMAISILSPVRDANLMAVRLVVSLENVDSCIMTIMLFAIFFGVVMVLLMLLSGSYFINSIVIPVAEIGKTARRIAQGDFKTRLSIKNDDEIGELCDTINYMAEELSNSETMKNDFISSVSHELRTPLTAIKGWSETILESPEDTEMLKKGMQIIIKESDRLSGMVEELLDFSRVQSGRLKLNIEKIDMLAELCDVVIMFSERAKREGIDFNYEENVEMAVVFGDKNRLRQVFINIIDNAIKYSEENKEQRIDISCDREDDFYVVRVKDNGQGISKKDLPHVKQKFYKTNYTRRGSGIGLAVADEIIAQMFGELSLDSVFGEGTEVSIKLPTEKKYSQLKEEKQKNTAQS